jgi:hypothetical protein
VAVGWTLRGESRIGRSFIRKEIGKSRVAVRHTRLPTKDAATEMRAFWDERLRVLAALL